MCFLCKNGRVYVQKAYEIPEGSRNPQREETIINFLEMQKDEKVSAIIAVDDFESEKSLVLCTKKEWSKRLRCWQGIKSSKR